MEERDGQHMGVVTKALVKLVPPSSIIFRVLFITCSEPERKGKEARTERLSFTETVISVHALLML